MPSRRLSASSKPGMPLTWKTRAANPPPRSRAATARLPGRLLTGRRKDLPLRSARVLLPSLRSAGAGDRNDPRPRRIGPCRIGRVGRRGRDFRHYRSAGDMTFEPDDSGGVRGGRHAAQQARGPGLGLRASGPAARAYRGCSTAGGQLRVVPGVRSVPRGRCLGPTSACGARPVGHRPADDRTGRGTVTAPHGGEPAAGAGAAGAARVAGAGTARPHRPGRDGHARTW